LPVYCLPIYGTWLFARLDAGSDMSEAVPYNQFMRMSRAALSSTGLSVARHGSHSFRRGRAGEMFHGGASEPAVAEMLRHESIASSVASCRAMVHRSTVGNLSFMEMRPPTSREALVHLVSWREPDAQQPGTAPAVPYWHPASGRWVLGYLPDAHLTDAARYDLVFSGNQHVRPAGGLCSPRVRELHLDAPQGAVLSRLLACAQIFDTAREAVREAIGPDGHYNPSRHPVVGGMRSAMARLIAGVDMAGHFMGPTPGSFPAVPPGLEQFRFRGTDGPEPARPLAAAGRRTRRRTRRRNRRRCQHRHRNQAPPPLGARAPGSAGTHRVPNRPEVSLPPFSPLPGREGHYIRHACD
jgi:hypothetical protein